MSIVLVENLLYGSVLGAGLLADVAFPKTGEKLPAIISVHGGRWIRGSRFDDGKDGRPNNGVIDLHRWAEAGFFAMRIDYRLVTCTPAPSCFQDTLCALRWIHHHAEEYGIDPNKVFLLGQSSGGHLVSLAATLGCHGYEQSGGWENAGSGLAAAISVAGAYDLCNLDWGSGWCPPGVPWNVARRHASPIEHVTRESRPLLIFHAEDDLSVPIQQADSFARKMEEVGARYVYHRFKAGGHLRISDDVYEKCQSFIQKVIGGLL